ncbi:PDR/VanB family oxidoreductase [Streptomyces sp. NPDC002928]|uniref:PDR/VanB family oxidoreductase n=1 Tax=Streptomyces sp. NPDC002928 TaxID=3154440 RepID=UPI0033B8843A
MSHRTTELTLRVAAVDDSVPGVRSLSLVAPDGGTLPSFTPGSHLVVGCGDRANAYSLTCEGIWPTSYEISVLRVADGRGGSVWIHDRLSIGDEVSVRPPRSAFAPVNKARRHLLVAGGIGITPLVAHVRAAVRWGRDFRLLYGYRDGHGAHLDELRELAGDRTEFIPEQPRFLGRIEDELADQPLGTHLYICGPAGLIDHVRDRASALGWPASRIHLERFGAGEQDPGEPFEVRLTASGHTVQVPAGVSLLEALEEYGLRIPHLCRQGVCGECRVPVASGRPLHRDLFLTDEEKAAGDSLMCCVSRAAGPRLELPL